MRFSLTAIGERIRITREAGHLSLSDVSGAVRVAPLPLRLIEEGKVDVRLSTVLAIAEYINVDPSWLIFGDRS
jgi:transcriptional regulator with XRE-family HTH domain